MYIALIINIYTIYGEMCVNLLLFGNYKVLLLFPHYLNRTCEPVNQFETKNPQID